jgi:hypothetical protein
MNNLGPVQLLEHIIYEIFRKYSSICVEAMSNLKFPDPDKNNWLLYV